MSALFSFLGRTAGQRRDTAGDILLLRWREKHAFHPLLGTNSGRVLRHERPFSFPGAAIHLSYLALQLFAPHHTNAL
ncbi:MAG: hypothetical protein R3292_01255 [Alcanivorax sp.]|nr:hypothetical protein [Alcanivorax sp.]